MSSKVLSFKVDEQLKSDFDKLSKDLGMPVSAMFTVFMKKSLIENGLPFEVKRSDEKMEWEKIKDNIFSNSKGIKVSPDDKESMRLFFED